MVDVDGSGGGGQILRTSLTLSMLSDEPVTVTDVRGDRPDPGLNPQHLTAVETAAAVCDAAVEGAHPGSETVHFDPGEPTGGAYEAAVGTAGSIALVFDTLLPVATALDEPLELAASGGTDAKWSPPLAYYRRVKLPLVRAHGLAAAVEPGRSGFYPAGGGRATLRLWPSTLSALALTGAGGVSAAEVYSLAADALADSDVADRQAETAAEQLADCGLEVTRREVAYAAADSPGSSLLVRLDGEGTTAGFDAYGEPGTPAEAVASDVVAAVSAFRGTVAAVDPHLADQLLVPLALAGGAVTIPAVTDHVETNCEVVEAFGYDLTVAESDDPVVVRAD